jgi:hypothetical protein
LVDTVNVPPAPPAITPGAFLQQYDALRLLHKLFALVKSLQTDAGSITWFLQNNKGIGWMQLDAIPYKAAQTAITNNEWESFLQVLQLLKKFTPVPKPCRCGKPLSLSFPLWNCSCRDILQLQPNGLTLLHYLPGMTGSWRMILIYTLGYSNPNLDAYRDPSTWLQFDTSVDYLRRLGVNVAKVQDFIKPVLIATDTANLQMALKARYDETLWLDTLKEIMDAIRPQKRDALVAYMLAVNPGLADENDLFRLLPGGYADGSLHAFFTHCTGAWYRAIICASAA